MTDPLPEGGNRTETSLAPQADPRESADTLALDLAEEWTSPEPAAESAGL